MRLCMLRFGWRLRNIVAPFMKKNMKQRLSDQKIMARATRGESIGIDLGTSYSSVGIWRNNKVEIIANEQGSRITPSYVGFNDFERLIGNHAKSNAAMNPENTVFGVKRLIGRKFVDSSVQADSKYFPFKVKPDDENGNPIIEVEYWGETKQFKAEEIYAMILGKMKDIAESYIGKEVANAVITVPAYFNDSQRRATKDAGAIAGLNVLRIINEPTAAAIAYGLQNQGLEEKNILVFDLGGGTFDVSILKVKDRVFDVKAVGGDPHMGGEDFDNRMVDYFVKDFRRRHRKDISQNKRSLRRLRAACERAKCILSSSITAEIEIENLYEGLNYISTISRSRFESLCLECFAECLELCKKALKDADMPKSQIDEVVLVGGSTCIPKLRSMISNFFYGKKPCMSINPDDAVVYGATVQAAILGSGGGLKGDITNPVAENLSDLIVLDVAPFSLSVETAGGLLTTLIKRNTHVPTKITHSISTHTDYQSNVLIKIYEGERFLAKYNNLLGTFNLTDIPTRPRGLPQIHVTYEIDLDGIFHVAALEDSKGIENTIAIINDLGRLSQEGMKRVVMDAKKYKAYDYTIRERDGPKIKVGNELAKLCHNLQSSVNIPSLDMEVLDDANSLEDDLINTVSSLEDDIVSTISWLESNQNAEKNEYERRHDQMKNIEICIEQLNYAQSCSNDSGDSITKSSGFVSNAGCSMCSSLAIVNDTSTSMLSDLGILTKHFMWMFI